MAHKVDTLLLTGYDKWHEVAYNTSWETLANTKFNMPPHWRVKIHCLPVSWTQAPLELAPLLDDNVKAVIAFGMKQSAVIQCEEIAHNIASTDHADVNSQHNASNSVDPYGPAHYKTTLPSHEILNALHHHHIPAERSQNAGDYLCNFIFYWLLNHITQAQHHTLAGFIHLPPYDAEGGLTSTQLCDAVQIIANTVVKNVDSQSNQATSFPHT